MNVSSNDPNDVGVTVIGGLTGLGEMTQEELEAKIKSVKKSCGAKTPLIMDEYWNAKKANAIDELRKEHPAFTVGQKD